MDLTNTEKDYLTELVNMAVGQAASVLNTLLENHISLQVPSIHITSAADLINLKVIKELKGKSFSSVRLDFEGIISGSASLIFSKEDSSKLISILACDADLANEDIDELHESTILEVGNIVINSLIGSICNLLDGHVDYDIPEFQIINLDTVMQTADQNSDLLVLLTHTQFCIDKIKANGNILLYFNPETFKHLLVALNKMMDS